MITSTTITKISVALLAAQKSMGDAKKDAKNPYFKSTYADLNAVREVAIPALNAEGISVLQPVGTQDGKHIVTTILLHESGEFLSETMILEVPKANMQDLGSAISYARRYGLQSFVNIGAVDDDGEGSMKRGNEKVDALPKTDVKKSSFNKNGQQATTNPAQQLAVLQTATNGALKQTEVAGDDW